MSVGDLTIEVERRGDSYEAEMHLITPAGDQSRLTGQRPSRLPLDLEALNLEVTDPTAYGQALAAMLFSDPALAKGWAKASGIQLFGVPLRVRLDVHYSAPELHTVRWETLRDPDSGTPLFTNDQVRFSRFLSSGSLQPARRARESQIRALIVVANPDLSSYPRLAPITVEDEVMRAREGLKGAHLTVLDQPRQATLDTIVTALRDGRGFDLLYLVAHGALIDGEPRLWLSDEEGKAKVVEGRALVDRLRDMQHKPRLVVLASCQSAASGNSPTAEEARGAAAEGSARSALAPLLIEAGIPAVLAMQGNFSMRTNKLFMSTFFRELLRDGVIDRALSVARSDVRERPDWWMPVLFMRLANGQLWEVEETQAHGQEAPPQRPINGVGALRPMSARLPAAASPPASRLGAVDKRTLREAMVRSLALDDLAIICVEVEEEMKSRGYNEKVDLDTLRGSGLNMKVLSLIQHMENRGQLALLAQIVEQHRPGIFD